MSLKFLSIYNTFYDFLFLNLSFPTLSGNHSPLKFQKFKKIIIRFDPRSKPGMTLKKIFFLQSIVYLLCNSVIAQPQFTIMLDPTGDGQYAGREIQDSFERGLTLQCAQDLKKQLLEQCSNVRVILTRAAGETIQPMHNALFANRLQADLYLRIGFYHEPDLPTHVALFYNCNNLQDFWQTYNPLQFFHIDQAYLLNLKLTKQLATNFLQILQNQQRNFTTYGAFAIPFKPFVGIQAPALYLEAGLANTTDWKYIIKPIIHFIETVAHASNGSL